MSPREYTNAKERILDAAERVLLESGIGGFSVDAVVSEARLSKGGFFHNFASKEELLAAVLQRLAAQCNAEIDAIAACDCEGAGSRLRAQVQLSFDMAPSERRRLRALVLALILATLSGGEAIAASARAANKEALKDAVADGIDAGRALLLQLALDGYWLNESIGTMALDARQKATFREALIELTRTEANPKPRSRK
jgi:AcrR family transcriptional regulator